MTLLDMVALLEDLPQCRLYKGQIGTIVEVYEPGVFEVEFVDTSGRTYGLEMLRENQLMKLYRHALTAA